MTSSKPSSKDSEARLPWSSCCASLPSQPEMRLDDVDYADCLIKALEAVVAFRNDESAQHSVVHVRNLRQQSGTKTS